MTNTEEEYFVYTDSKLWASGMASRWWLLDVPEEVLLQDSLVSEGYDNETNSQSKNVQDIVLFTLTAENITEKNVTVRIPSDTLSILEVHKYPSALVVGFIAPSQQADITEKKDCYISGQHHTVLVMQPTYPRLDNIERIFSLNTLCEFYNLFNPTNSIRNWKFGKSLKAAKISMLFTHTQAAQHHIQRFLLSGMFVYCHCSRLIAEDDSLWLKLSHANVFNIFKYFCTTARLKAYSLLSLSWESIISIQNDKDGLLYGCPPEIVLQILSFFCDITSKDYNIDQICQQDGTNKMSLAFCNFIRQLTDISQDIRKDKSISLSLNMIKVGKLLLRYQAFSNSSLTEVLEHVASDLLSILPPEIIDCGYINSVTYRNQTNLGHNNNFSDIPIRGNFCLKSPPLLFSDQQQLFLLTKHVPKHFSHFTLMSRVIRLEYLYGFATFCYSNDSALNNHINKNSIDELNSNRRGVLRWFPHYSLSWDWKERLLEVYKLKQHWSLEELETYLSPLRTFTEVPPIDKIAANLLLKCQGTSIASSEHPVFVYKRIRIDEDS